MTLSRAVALLLGLSSSLRVSGWASYYGHMCDAPMTIGAQIMGSAAAYDHASADDEAAAPSSTPSSDFVPRPSPGPTRPDTPRVVGWLRANGTAIACGGEYHSGERLVATLSAPPPPGRYAEHVFEARGGARFEPPAGPLPGAATAACDGHRAYGTWRGAKPARPKPAPAPGNAANAADRATELADDEASPPEVESLARALADVASFAVARAPDHTTADGDNETATAMISVWAGYAETYNRVWLTSECTLVWSGRDTAVLSAAVTTTAASDEESAACIAEDACGA